MTLIEAIILGIVQGLTEFIPVSSSGHLIIMHRIFGIDGIGLVFDVALHIGTLTALVLYFHKDIVNLIFGILGKNEYKKLAWLIVVATIPAVIAGVLLQSTAESSFRSTRLVGINLIIVAFIMMWAEYVSRRHNNRTPLDKISRTQAITMGAAQAIALIPGVSRSGSTITAGLFLGMERVAATRFSFLLAIPITAGAIVKLLSSSAGMSAIGSDPSVFVVGIVTSFVTGLFAIRFLLNYLKKRTLLVFAYYRIALGLGVLLFLG